MSKASVSHRCLRAKPIAEKSIGNTIVSAETLRSANVFRRKTVAFQNETAEVVDLTVESEMIQER